MKGIILIGYSGHAYVAADIILKMGRPLAGYCDREEKESNPFEIPYLGPESSARGFKFLSTHPYFIAIGDNKLREKICESLLKKDFHPPINAIHPMAVLGSGMTMGKGIMIAANVAVNPMSQIGEGVILNTGSIIEHECIIHHFAHIAPGATLAGNVRVGPCSFVGANAVVKQGITIGSNVTIGAGAVVIKDVPDNATVVGNPGSIA